MGMTNTNKTEANQTETEQTGCCGGPAPAGTSACCALDAEVKESGGAGCGCTTAKPATPTKKGCC